MASSIRSCRWKRQLFVIAYNGQVSVTRMNNLFQYDRNIDERIVLVVEKYPFQGSIEPRHYETEFLISWNGRQFRKGHPAEPAGVRRNQDHALFLPAPANGNLKSAFV